MLNQLEHFYFDKEEPNKGCLLALKSIILSLDEEVETSFKYSLPFFSFRGRMFCYLSIEKKSTMPYIGVVEGGRISHPALEQGNRKRMKILRLDPRVDLPIEIITDILQEALDFYRSGLIKTKGKKN